MPDIETPQFDLPFRLDGRAVRVVEQDSLDDVANSVETLMRTPLGSLDENPDYGVVDGTFDEGRVDLNEIQTAISQWEPRADTLMEDNSDYEDMFLRKIATNVGVRRVG